MGLGPANECVHMHDHFALHLNNMLVLAWFDLTSIRKLVLQARLSHREEKASQTTSMTILTNFSHAHTVLSVLARLSHREEKASQTTSMTVLTNFSHAHTVLSVLARQVPSSGTRVYSTAQSEPKDKRKLWLLIIPVTTFFLGTWQIFRLQWKLGLIDELEKKTMASPIDMPSK